MQTTRAINRELVQYMSMVLVPLFKINTDSIAVRNSSYGRPNKAVHYSSIMCNGAEDNLTQCIASKLSLNVGKQFKTAAAAGVSCSSSEMAATTQPPCIASPQTPANAACTNGTTRLIGGQTTAEGRLEYCYNEQWSPFCTLRHQEAAVACKELGFTQYKCQYNGSNLYYYGILLYVGGAILTDGSFGSISSYSLFKNITCSSTASEPALRDCTLHEAGSCLPTCKNIAIRCYGKKLNNSYSNFHYAHSSQ